MSIYNTQRYVKNAQQDREIVADITVFVQIGDFDMEFATFLTPSNTATGISTSEEMVSSGQVCDGGQVGSGLQVIGDGKLTNKEHVSNEEVGNEEVSGEEVSEKEVRNKEISNNYVSVQEISNEENSEVDNIIQQMVFTKII